MSSLFIARLSSPLSFPTLVLLDDLVSFPFVGLREDGSSLLEMFLVDSGFCYDSSLNNFSLGSFPSLGDSPFDEGVPDPLPGGRGIYQVSWSAPRLSGHRFTLASTRK